MTIEEDNYIEELDFTTSTDKILDEEQELNKIGNTTIDRGFEINEELENFKVGFRSYRSDDINAMFKRSFLGNSMMYSPPLSASPPPHESEEEKKRRLVEILN